MTKLGLLFLQDGYVDLKNQIISSDWVKQSTNSPDGSPYGFLWWLDLFGQGRIFCTRFRRSNGVC